MKKKIIIILSIIFVVGITIIMGIFLYKNVKENKEQARYNEIKENVKKGVEWKLRANYPKCPIKTQ